MIKKISWASIVLTLLLIGCTSVKRSEPASKQVYSSVKDVALNVNPIVTVPYGKHVVLNIEDSSPSIQGKRAPNKVEVVAVEGTADKPFAITVTTRCDCLGFRKYSVYPIASLVDQMGESIGTSQDIGPKTRVLKGVFPANGLYKVVVIADNTKEGEKLSDVNAYVGGIPIFTIPEVVHPTGKVEVNFQAQP